ncbi:hypothetical protein [Paraburkholderia strydomiana]|uniref:Uncharacterized protein n=1 Tax=Paraburkholderia strydomiana TaxID=1245417 RepID=A0ABW9BVV4_9BURK
MAAADRNCPSCSEKTAFFPPSLDSVKRQGKKLRKLLGKEALCLGKAYNLAARLFGCQSYAAIRQAYLSNDVRPTVWDHELSESQLRERRSVQAQVLAAWMQVSEEDALEILDVGRFSARNVDVIDDQTVAEEFRVRPDGRVGVDAGERRAFMRDVELDDSSIAAAGAISTQVKMVSRKRRLVQRAV